MKAHVLVVQDDQATSKLLDRVLCESGYQTTTLTDSRAITPALRRKNIDLVLLDVALPYLDGFTLCATLRSEHPDIPIIFLTEHATLRDKMAGFRQGADDYITKPFEPNELLARVRAVLQQYRRIERPLSDTVVTVGDTSLNIGTLQFSAPTRRPILLTPTEIRLLECLMRNANAVVSRTTLIERTHGDQSADGNSRTDVYIRRLRKKIEANPDDPALIHTIGGEGYIYRDPQTHAESAGLHPGYGKED